MLTVPGDLPIEQGVPLWKHTSIRVGGPARYYARPTNRDDLREVLDWAFRAGCPHIVLGGGTNVVFPDVGFDGLIVSTEGLRGRSLIDGDLLRVAAGERLSTVARWASEQGLSGLEWACGIPGSIGGAVAMNAGAHGGGIAGILESADVVSNGSVLTYEAESLRFGYRSSALRAGDVEGIVVEATFSLRREDPTACLERASAVLCERQRKLPVGASAGSIFRNPGSGPTAGALLERADCKGLRRGRAVVAMRHANVIVNEGSDNAGDVLGLIDEMKRQVRDRFGVELREEIVRFDGLH